MALLTRDQESTTQFIQTSSQSKIAPKYCSQQFDRQSTTPMKTQPKFAKCGAASTQEMTLPNPQQDAPGASRCNSMSPLATYQQVAKGTIRKSCASKWCMTLKSVVGMSGHITPLGK